MILTRLISGCQPIARVTRSVFAPGEIIPPETITSTYIQKRNRKSAKFTDMKRWISPRSWWLAQKKHKYFEEDLTRQNREFLDDYKKIESLEKTSPLKFSLKMPEAQWEPNQRRTGVIARKIGTYPLWTKQGSRVLMTLLQVSDNHVIKYTPPEEFLLPEHNKKFEKKFNGRCASILVGAEDADPEQYTGAYNALFHSAGLSTKRRLARFLITPEAALEPGTPLTAMHFQPGDYVDVWGKTFNHGYQGVMKRWGFKGGSATHGNTKSHRRGGCIGGGAGKKHGLWKGTKMPGYMGNRWRAIRGIKVWRINTKENVLYVGGLVPGFTNDFVRIRDTCMFHKKRKEIPPPFPTYFPEESEEVPENLYAEELHPMDAPSIMFSDEPPPQQNQEKIKEDIERIKKLFRL